MAVLREVKYLNFQQQKEIPESAEKLFSENETFRKFVGNLELIVGWYNEVSRSGRRQGRVLRTQTCLKLLPSVRGCEMVMAQSAATGGTILVGLWLILHKLWGSIGVTPHRFHCFVKPGEVHLLEPRWEWQVAQLVRRKLCVGLERDHHLQLLVQESLDSLAPQTWRPDTAATY